MHRRATHRDADSADPTRDTAASAPRDADTDDATRANDDPTVVPLNDHAPKRLSQFTARAWWGVLKRTVKEFNKDNLTDWAAALTYYGILSIFPGLVVLLAAFSLLKDQTEEAVINNLTSIVPGSIAGPLNSFVQELHNGQHSAGLLALVGLVGALWTSSGYVSAFMRASNAIYDVPEGRPMWKTLPIRLGVTIVVGTLIALAAVSVVFTGKFALEIGKVFGLGQTAVTVWDYAKWPALLLVLMLVLAILYWASPNARQSGFRWVTPGGGLAVIVWLIASGGFALYVSNFSSYNKTYGALGGIIAFLVWLWISNIAILLGAEFDAELERARAIEGGHPAKREPYIALRDDRKVGKDEDPGLGS